MKKATLALVYRGVGENQELLMIFKKSGEIGANTLNGPGGKREEKDFLNDDGTRHSDEEKSLVTCVVRETEEEAGTKIFPHKLEKVAVITFYAAGVPDFEVHFYSTSEYQGEPHETHDAIPVWHKINNLPYERMLESDKEFFPRLINGEKFRANVYYKERAAKFDRIEYLPF